MKVQVCIQCKLFYLIKVVKLLVTSHYFWLNSLFKKNNNIKLSISVFFSRLMNKLEPSAPLNKVISGKVPTLAFKIMEVINLAVNAMEKYGVPKTELFQTVDLYEAQNLNAVLIACSAVGRKVSMSRLSLNLVCQN